MTNMGAHMTAFAKAAETSFRNRSATNGVQEAAYERFLRLGLPTRRIEGWKWSDFNAVLRGEAPQNEETAIDQIAPSRFAHLEPLEIQIVDGRVLAPDAARLEGVEFGMIEPGASDPAFDNHALVALNIALTRRAFGYRVRQGAVVERPIHIRHITTRPGQFFSQVLGRTGKESRLTIIESFEGAPAFYSAIHHLGVHNGSQVQRFVMHEANADAVTHGFCGAMIGESAGLQQTSLSTGGRLCRHETHLLYPSAKTRSDVAGAALLTGAAHNDFTTQVALRAPDGVSRQLHKSVAREKGRAVFQGKFRVDRLAQKTDAKMTANALLLSDSAEANHKPELEIYADDVECAHGSTVGALDDEALFYLRQRGLSETQARALMIKAFVGEVMDTIDSAKIRASFEARVAEWLEA